MDFNLYVIHLPLSSSFLIGTKKLIYFSVFSLKHSNCPSNFSANSLIIKWLSHVEPLWNTTGISFGVLCLRFQI